MDKHGSYTLLVRTTRVPVSKEVYKAYYQLRNREKYLDKLALEKNISLEHCAEKGVSVEYIISNTDNSVEDIIILKEMISKMLCCIQTLDSSEKQLIMELYFHGKSERQLSRETGVPQRTINDRNRKILSKLRKLIEK